MGKTNTMDLINLKKSIEFKYNLRGVFKAKWG